MLKSCIKFFCILHIVLFSSFAYAEVPSWYSGDENLYNEFVHGCNIAKKKCPDKDISCEVSSQDEFEKIYINVKNCVNTNINFPSCVNGSCKTKTNSVSVASSRA